MQTIDAGGTLRSRVVTMAVVLILGVAAVLSGCGPVHRCRLGAPGKGLTRAATGLLPQRLHLIERRVFEGVEDVRRRRKDGVFVVFRRDELGEFAEVRLGELVGQDSAPVGG